jgi:glycosyltransferase involved in cell wall biosynthesis
MQANKDPFISVVICTYNRDRFIGETLNCLSKQTLSPAAFELIVVDNNSTDNTASITKNFIDAHSFLQARYVYEPRKGLSFARNRGIQEAKASIIAYIDDDVILANGYLEAIYYFFTTHISAAGMGGKTLPRFPDGDPPKWLSSYLTGITGTVDYGNELKRFSRPMKYPGGCNMAYKKDILLEAGGFNNELKARADDKYIFEKVKKINSEIWYVPDAFSLHTINAERLSFNSFKKLYLKGGNEEKIKTKSEGFTSFIKKGADLLAKCIAGLGLWMLFTIKGNYIKGKYVFLAQWYTWYGFLKKDVHVR